MKEGIRSLWRDEDYWAIWFGFIIIFGALLGLFPTIPKIGAWTDDPLDAFRVITDAGLVTGNILLPVLGLLAGLCILTLIGVVAMKTDKAERYAASFIVIFLLACVSYWIAHQTNVKYWGLSYAMWALLVGLLISNTIGTPEWLKSGAKTELFIKTGLVLLGAEVLFGKIVSLGPPGLMVAWIVTPVVVIFMFIFATKYLKMKNKRLW